MKLLIWKIKVFLMKLRYPSAGYYERMCLVAGYKRSDIDRWVDEEKRIGAYASDVEMREDLCESEVGCWE